MLGVLKARNCIRSSKEYGGSRTSWESRDDEGLTVDEPDLLE